MGKSKAVVLLSGGMDSATALAIAGQDGFRCFALTCMYGQRHCVEVEGARRIADAMGVAEHRVMTVDLAAFGGSALTDGAARVPPGSATRQAGRPIPVTYVPARNLVFLGLALAWAEVMGAFDIYIGVHATDYAGYPDCRPVFIEAFERVANVATAAAVEGRGPFRIHAPLMELTKAQIIRRGLELGVDYSLTHSCYDPDEQGRSCGRCDSCLLRLGAFADLGLSDPIPYQIARPRG